jgi:hypothetical protein
MTSMHASTFSNFQSLAPYRDNLDLSYDDEEFSSGVRNPLYVADISAQSQDYGDVQEVVLRQLPASVCDRDIAVRDNYSFYSLLKHDPNLSGFKAFIDHYDYSDYLNQQQTVFVPVNAMMRDLVKRIEQEQILPFDVLKFHVLNYVLVPDHIKDRTVRVQTALRDQHFLIKDMAVISEGYIKDVNKIIGYYQTDNGMAYILERPLFPYVY